MAKTTNVQSPAEETITKTEAFVTKYKNAIIYGVLAVVVVVAGFICVKNFYLTPRQNEASTAMAKSQDYFAQQQFDKALNGDGAGSIGFLKVIDQYGMTDASNLAKLYAGLCYANLGKMQEAAQYIEGYSSSDDAMVSPAAEAALGNVYANLNKIDDAISCLKKAAKMADSQSSTGKNMSLSAHFLLQAGELLESQNKQDEALAIYKQIKEDYIKSAEYGEIDKYIERCTK